MTPFPDSRTRTPAASWGPGELSHGSPPLPPSFAPSRGCRAAPALLRGSAAPGALPYRWAPHADTARVRAASQPWGPSPAHSAGTRWTGGIASGSPARNTDQPNNKPPLPFPSPGRPGPRGTAAGGGRAPGASPRCWPGALAPGGPSLCGAAEPSAAGSAGRATRWPRRRTCVRGPARGTLPLAVLPLTPIRKGSPPLGCWWLCRVCSLSPAMARAEEPPLAWSAVGCFLELPRASLCPQRRRRRRLHPGPGSA